MDMMTEMTRPALVGGTVYDELGLDRYDRPTDTALMVGVATGFAGLKVRLMEISSFQLLACTREPDEDKPALAYEWFRDGEGIRRRVYWRGREMGDSELFDCFQPGYYRNDSGKSGTTFVLHVTDEH